MDAKQMYDAEAAALTEQFLKAKRAGAYTQHKLPRQSRLTRWFWRRYETLAFGGPMAKRIIWRRGFPPPVHTRR